MNKDSRDSRHDPASAARPDADRPEPLGASVAAESLPMPGNDATLREAVGIVMRRLRESGPGTASVAAQHTDTERALLEAALALHSGDLTAGRAALRAWVERCLRNAPGSQAEALVAAHRLLASRSRTVEVEPARGATNTHGAARICITLLGGFELEIDGQPVRFRRRPPRRLLLLLKWLAVQRHDGVPMALLADALWPDSEGDHAVNALKVAMHRLRILLRGQDAILITDGVASLDPLVCATDVQAFGQAVDRAMQHRALADGDAFERSALHALSLYAGPLLPGEEPFPWLMAARDRMARVFGQMALAVGERFEATDRPERASGLYEFVLQHEPLEESVCRALMNQHLRHGRYREAVAAYERCRQALSSSVGLPPSQELQALHRRAVQRSREDVA